MAVDVRVQIDTRQFVERMEFSAREAVNAMRRTVDKTARALVKTRSRPCRKTSESRQASFATRRPW